VPFTPPNGKPQKPPIKSDNPDQNDPPPPYHASPDKPHVQVNQTDAIKMAEIGGLAILSLLAAGAVILATGGAAAPAAALSEAGFIASLEALALEEGAIAGIEMLTMEEALVGFSIL
jgi:hypothetical protein